MKKFLSATEIVDLMRRGWQLGYTSGCRTDGWYSIQQGGIGRGGKSIDVHANTVHAMYRHKIIVIDRDGFPTRTYKLAKMKGESSA